MWKIYRNKRRFNCRASGDIEDWIKQWKINRKLKVSKSKDNEQIDAIISIKRKITNELKKFGICSRIIYRTVQNDFGNESPHNLIPLKKEKGRWSIFLSYDYKIRDDRLIEIIAFKDEDSYHFPKIKKSRFNEEKVDLKRLDKKYKFKTITELLNRITDNSGVKFLEKFG